MGSVTPDEIPAKVFAEAGKPPPTNWREIRAPRLGIFAPFTREGRQAYYWYLSPAKQAEFDAGWGPIGRLGAEDHWQVRGREHSEHVPPAQCSPLYLHQQRGRSRALDAGFLGHTAKILTREGM